MLTKFLRVCRLPHRPCVIFSRNRRLPFVLAHPPPLPCVHLAHPRSHCCLLFSRTRAPFAVSSAVSRPPFAVRRSPFVSAVGSATPPSAPPLCPCSAVGAATPPLVPLLCPSSFARFCRRRRYLARLFPTFAVGAVLPPRRCYLARLCPYFPVGAARFRRWLCYSPLGAATLPVFRRWRSSFPPLALPLPSQRRHSSRVPPLVPLFSTVGAATPLSAPPLFPCSAVGAALFHCWRCYSPLGAAINKIENTLRASARASATTTTTNNNNNINNNNSNQHNNKQQATSTKESERCAGGVWWCMVFYLRAREENVHPAVHGCAGSRGCLPPAPSW
jgi:hypothetical protein